jgi:hypothetical protein
LRVTPTWGRIEYMMSRKTVALVAGGCLIILLVAACAVAVAGLSAFELPSLIAGATATATQTAVSTPTPIPTLTSSPTPVPSPSASATFTPAPSPAAETVATPTAPPGPTKEPKPTPTPWLMQLRDDLPPLRLQDWPRPPDDNGWGIHFQYFNEGDLEVQIARMKELRFKWALVVYGDENFLRMAAPRFKEAGIVVVWRRTLQAHDPYYDWARDIKILQEAGMPPYMQAYNEPTLQAEWDEEQEMDEWLFIDLLLTASRDIYNAGGYVGWQFVEDEWLTDALHALKSHGGERIYRRMFFVPHAYGLNHPPDYDEDVNAVLGFLHYADLFQREIGYVPPMVVGEGGWKYGGDDDNRFPKVDEKLYSEYYAALYNWFRSGVLSNGQPLPDYLFAFCPWILSSPTDPNAFYDSFVGDHAPTKEAIKALPPFKRKFSWGF